MERYGFRLFVQADKIEEYKRRHDEIWPEMTQMLNEAGIHNYSIWNIATSFSAITNARVSSALRKCSVRVR